MRRPRLKLLAPILLVLLVASAMLLMHGFESVSPETLATHGVHAVDGADAKAIAAGICVFVIVMVATVAGDLAMAATLLAAIRPQTRPWTTSRSVGREPPRSFSYELCVMRV